MSCETLLVEVGDYLMKYEDIRIYIDVQLKSSWVKHLYWEKL